MEKQLRLLNLRALEYVTDNLLNPLLKVNLFAPKGLYRYTLIKENTFFT